MALPISDTLEALLKNPVLSLQIIMEVEGWPIFGSLPVQRPLQYGDPVVYGDDITYGGLIDYAVASPGSDFPYIDMKRTTQAITQQMQSDKGGFSSTTSFDVFLVDKGGLVSELITPTPTNDILAKKVKMFLSIKGAAHPRDSVPFFSGIVAGAIPGAGFVQLQLSSPEKKKQLKLFPKVSTELSGSINTAVTTIPVVSTDGFSLPADSGTLRTYVTINEEIIEYTGLTANSFTGCTRGAFGTTPAAGVAGDNVESSYRLAGNVRDLALKLMLSGANDWYVTDVPILATQDYLGNSIANAIFVSRYKFDEYYGTVSGDLINISGDPEAGNNGDTTVQSVVSTSYGSYLILNKTLVPSAGGVFKLKSKYAVLPKYCGLEMTPDEVDISEFENKYNQFSASFFEYDFEQIKDEVVGSDFINTQILYPSGCYSLPRKTKTSMGLTIPPLAQSETVVLSKDNILNPDKLRIQRDISNFFYNAVTYKYDKDPITDKYRRGKIRQSADSTNRIKIGNKPLTVVSDGLHQDSNFEGIVDIQGRRFLDRYQYAAEYMNVEVLYSTGFKIEIGDTVILNGDGLFLTDIKNNGKRTFLSRLFEVQNVVKNIVGKPVQLKLVDTAFALNGRYGVISPSSKMRPGSSDTLLKLKKSFGTTLTTKSEGAKWRPFIGMTVRVRSKDYAFDHERTLVGIDPTDDDAIIVSPALPSAPDENYLVDIPKYPTSSDPQINALFKAIFVAWNNQIAVTGGTSQTEFAVDPADVPDIAEGYLVKIHDDDYTNVSVEAVVESVSVGGDVVVDRALGFTPSGGQKIELLGFPDGGRPYRWL